MRKLILTFISIFVLFLLQLSVFAEPNKVMSLNYDDNGSIVYFNVKEADSPLPKEIKFIHLENPNRIYFDLSDSVLIGEKQQLVFEKNYIKEIRLSQFSTNPDVVRSVITFEEDFDTSKLKIINLNGNVIVKTQSLLLKNEYFNPIYDENPVNMAYSSIVANSQAIQRVALPKSTNSNNEVINEIQQAFENSTLNNSNGKTYESIVSMDLSSNLKLRTKYFISGCYPKREGFLINGIGQLTISKSIVLSSPSRYVIDMPNTFVAKKLRNKEIKSCNDGSCKDSIKIGQFEYNKARIVINTEKTEKYIPVFSSDSQSILIVDADKFDHTSLSNYLSNLAKCDVKKIDSKNHVLELVFTTPINLTVHRKDDSLGVFIFNAKSFNEIELNKKLDGTFFEKFNIALLPQVGIKGTLPVGKGDVVRVEQSIDGRLLRIYVQQQEDVKKEVVKNKNEETEVVVKSLHINKDKIVLDPGHGGSDYGAIRDGINEKDITLDVSLRVANILKSRGYKVVLTRNDDTYLSLQERVDVAEKEEPEIFVSIHVNSAVATEPSGIETHYYHDYSKQLANVVHSKLVKEISQAKNRGLFKSKFYVINHTRVPAILVEMGFLSNSDERAELITDVRKQKTAKAIAEGIIEYCKSSTKK